MNSSRFSWAITISLWFFCGLPQINSKDVRITPGVDKYDGKDPNALSYESPKPYWGPDASFFLNEDCFVGMSGTTEYKVCPFQNVTQKRSGSTRSVLLGVWNEWLIPESASASFHDSSVLSTTMTLVNSSYVQGARCGGPKNNYKSTIVEFKCIESVSLEAQAAAAEQQEGEVSPEFAVLGITDKDACNYHISFNFPLPCALLRYTHTKSPPGSASEQRSSPADSTVETKASTPNAKDSPSSSDSVSGATEFSEINGQIDAILANMSASGGSNVEGGAMGHAQYSSLITEVSASDLCLSIFESFHMCLFYMYWCTTDQISSRETG